MDQPEEAPAFPTRLVLISGPDLALYEGRQRISQYETEGRTAPIDRGYLAEVLEAVYSPEWSDAMTKEGRKFPMLVQPGDERVGE